MTLLVRAQRSFTPCSLVCVVHRLCGSHICIHVAAYKRAFHLVRNDIPAADITQEDIQQLQMFLGNPYHPKLVIVNQLREQCKLIPKHTEVLLEMIHICCDRIEKGIHVTPDEKYSLHRVLAYLVFMIDDPGKNSFNAFKARKLPLTRVQKIIRALPVIPQIGDMTLNLPAIITLSPNYQQDKMSSQWGAFPAQPVKDYYSLPTHWQRMRDTHTSFTCKFATMTTNEGLAELLSDVKGERTIEAMKVRRANGPTFVRLSQQHDPLCSYRRPFCSHMCVAGSDGRPQVRGGKGGAAVRGCAGGGEADQPVDE